MTRTGAEIERALRDRAVAEAAEMFADLGDAAAQTLTVQIHDPLKSADERRRHRLARTEVERLGRERRDGRDAQALVVWRPPLFSWARIAAMFGLRKPPSPRTRRR